MRVLIACEFSGIVRDAFAALGHDAWSCDLLPCERGGKHIVGDVLKVLSMGIEVAPMVWDTRSFHLLIAHPPCTYLCNSGVRWLHAQSLRRQKMIEAANFFKALLNAPITRVCVENPILHKYALDIIGEKYSQIIQPWQFGHGETKATCLWLKNLPKLEPTSIVSGRTARVHFASPGPNRWKERSRTFEGVAKAMAAQWGQIS